MLFLNRLSAFTATVALLISVAPADSVEFERSPAPPAPAIVSRQGAWWIVDTVNFRVCTLVSETETRRLANTCETLRSTLGHKWLGVVTDPWTPRCYVVLHANADSYLREVGAGQQTAGSSLMNFKAAKVVGRRIDLRADHPEGYLDALAHEMTHVVLADRFVDHPLPRWADEGMAVLADSTDKQASHLRDLRQAHHKGQAFRIAELLTMKDYPQQTQIPVFYGQSLSLVDYLVAKGEPQDFPRFIEIAIERGYDAALSEVYQIDNVAELEIQWRRQLNMNWVLSQNTRRS